MTVPEHATLKAWDVLKKGDSSPDLQSECRGFKGHAPSGDKNTNTLPISLIYVLPDEVLSLIFESRYTPDPGGFSFAIRVSHVSRRFRTAALSTPRLWSTVSNVQAPEAIREFVQRSGRARLRILIYMDIDPFEEAGKAHVEKFMDVMIPHYHRWSLPGDVSYEQMPAVTDQHVYDTANVFDKIKLLLWKFYWTCKFHEHITGAKFTVLD